MVPGSERPEEPPIFISYLSPFGKKVTDSRVLIRSDLRRNENFDMVG